MPHTENSERLPEKSSRMMSGAFLSVVKMPINDAVRMFGDNVFGMSSDFLVLASFLLLTSWSSVLFVSDFLALGSLFLTIFLAWFFFLIISQCLVLGLFVCFYFLVLTCNWFLTMGLELLVTATEQGAFPHPSCIWKVQIETIWKEFRTLVYQDAPHCSSLVPSMLHNTWSQIQCQGTAHITDFPQRSLQL